MKTRTGLLLMAVLIGCLGVGIYFRQPPTHVSAQTFRFPLICDQNAPLTQGNNQIAIPPGPTYVVAICGWSFTNTQPALVNFVSCTKTTADCDTNRVPLGGTYPVPNAGTFIEFGVGVSPVLLAPAGKEVFIVAQPYATGGAQPTVGGNVSYTIYQPQ